MLAAFLPDRAAQWRPFRRPFLGAAALLLLLLLVVAVMVQAGRRGGAGSDGSAAPPAAIPAAFRDLRFEDRADGAVTVYDAGLPAPPVAVLDPGTNGFVRGTLRALARDRRREDTGKEAPFRVARWADGRVTLQDRATGRVVDLDAFGHTNVDAFARFLPSRGQP